MKTVLELVSERDAALQAAANIIEQVEADEREMTEAEEHQVNLSIDKAEKLNKEIERRQKFETASAPAFAAQGRQGSTGEVTAALPNDEVRPASAPTAPEARPRVEIPRSYGKLVAFPKTPDGEFRAFKVGKWLQATVYGNHQAQQWCRDNGVGVRAALSGGVNTAGGVLVPEEMERAVIDLRELHGVFRRATRVVPMGSDSRDYPIKTGQLTAYWRGEGATLTDATQAFTNAELSAKKLTCLTLMSSEIEEDAVVDLADMTAADMAWAFAYAEDLAGFTGDGTSTYGGIRGLFVKAIDGSHTQGTIGATSTHKTFATLTSDDLLSCMGYIGQYAKPGSAWFCSPTCLELTFNAIKLAGGGNTIPIMENAEMPRFLGYPIYVSTVLPDSATTDYSSAAMLAFGNLGLASLMGSRRGIRIQMSTERYFDTDQIGIKATERIDIVVHSLGSSTTKSPIVVLTGTT